MPEERSDTYEALFRFGKKLLVPPWPELEPVINDLSRLTGLASRLNAYPNDATHIRRACEAFRETAKTFWKYDLKLPMADEDDLDIVLNRHVIDPDVRRHFQGAECSDPDLVQKVRIPDSPLLVYCIGAYLGENLAARDIGRWYLPDPVRPLQKLSDGLHWGLIGTIHPFAYVTKKLLDPEGDRIGPKAMFACLTGPTPRGLAAEFLSGPEELKGVLLGAKGMAAKNLFNGGKSDHALALYQDALKDEPRNGLLLYLAAQILMMQAEWAQARELYARLVNISPTAHHKHNLAICLSNTGDLKQATELAEQTLEIDPDYWRCHVTLASFYVKSNRREEALSLLRRTVSACDNSEIKAQATEFLRDLGES